jgi:hypothetical protein
MATATSEHWRVVASLLQMRANGLGRRRFPAEAK